MSWREKLPWRRRRDEGEHMPRVSLIDSLNNISAQYTGHAPLVGLLPLSSDLLVEVDLLSEVYEEDIQRNEFLAAAFNYLRAPLVVDTFEDHNDRRRWRDQLEMEKRDERIPVILELLMQNPLRANNISTVLNFIPKRFRNEELRTHLKLLPEYKNISTEEKVDYVLRLKFLLVQSLKSQ